MFLEKNKIEVKIFLLKVEIEKDVVVIYLVSGFGSRCVEGLFELSLVRVKYRKLPGKQ